MDHFVKNNLFTNKQFGFYRAMLSVCLCPSVTSRVLLKRQNIRSHNGATENARPGNAGLENYGQLRKESQGLENAGLENDGPC